MVLPRCYISVSIAQVKFKEYFTPLSLSEREERCKLHLALANDLLSVTINHLFRTTVTRRHSMVAVDWLT